MLGEIRGLDVCRHPLAIVRGFGAGALLRCVVAVATGRRCTFLELALAKGWR